MKFTFTFPVNCVGLRLCIAPLEVTETLAVLVLFFPHMQILLGIIVNRTAQRDMNMSRNV